MIPTLHYCRDSRAMRTLWTLLELGAEHKLVKLPFPPRAKAREFLEINPLGTVPALEIDGVVMTESAATAQYLAEKYKALNPDLSLSIQDPGYADYLNWLHRSDATFTFPQALILRYRYFEPDHRKSEQVAEDYRKWVLSRLRSVEAAVERHSFLCNDRFTVADICVGYALYLAELIGLGADLGPNTRAYLERLTKRQSFQDCLALQAELDPLI